jgi:nucleoid DNA-binding protein
MAKQLSKEDYNTIEILRNISGENEDRIHAIFEALVEHALHQYADKQRIEVPYFGTLYIKYKGETILSNGAKEVDIDVFFSPSKNLKKNIGRIEDLKKSLIEFVDVPVTNEKLNKIEALLKTQVSETYQDVRSTLD